MVLGLVRWAYKLGVRNERHRIAAYLQAAQTKRHDAMSMFDSELRNEPIRDNKDAKKRDIEKRLHQKDVDRDVVNIIDGLFHADKKYERGASIMFPDEGEL